MSGSTPESAAVETELLAAEYVLGTLEPADRAALAREAETDPALRQAIDAWERHLAPLNGLGDPVAPPAALWPRIEASAWNPAAVQPAAPPPAAPAAVMRGVPDRGSRGLRLWQGTAAAGFALAAVIAGVAFLRPPPPAPPLVTALLPLGQQGPVFVAETTPDGGLSVRPVGALHVAPDRDLELWLLKDGDKAPTPLGLLRGDGVRLAAGTLPRAGAKILVSLEPRGGSPTRLPTGPVLYGGAF